MPEPRPSTVLDTLRRGLADAVLPWASRHATVWPSQHAVHAELVEARRAERAHGEYLVNRLDGALQAVDPEYVGSPFEVDEVQPFLAGADHG